MRRTLSFSGSVEFQCTLCDQSFSHPSLTLEHFLIHLNRKSCACGTSMVQIGKEWFTQHNETSCKSGCDGADAEQQEHIKFVDCTADSEKAIESKMSSRETRSSKARTLAEENDSESQEEHEIFNNKSSAESPAYIVESVEEYSDSGQSEISEAINSRQKSVSTPTRRVMSGYECYICRYTDARKLIFLLHMHEKHAFGLEAFCSVVWNDLGVLNAESVCTICNEKLSRPWCLYVHIYRKHFEQFQNMELARMGLIKSCDVCRQPYFLHRERVHLDINHRKMVRKPSKICHICGKQLYCKSELEQHMNKHEGRRPFSCHICSKSYTKRKVLSAHVQRHFNPGVKKYKCTVERCDKAYTENIMLKRHMFDDHGLLITKLDCPICKKPFPYTAYLKQHMRREHKDKVLEQ